jgi:hypothetical protein
VRGDLVVSVRGDSFMCCRLFTEEDIYIRLFTEEDIYISRVVWMELVSVEGDSD